MKAKLVSKSTIVLLDGNYRYTIKKTGSGKEDFKVKKEKFDDDDFDVFDEVEEDEKEEDEEEVK